MGIKSHSRFWLVLAIFMTIVAICLAIALIAVAVTKDDNDSTRRCGSTDSNIDTSEATKPGPFHDVTKAEIDQLKTYLENDPDIQGRDMDTVNVGENKSHIASIDLYLPPKSEILAYLDKGGKQPERQARVMLFRYTEGMPRVEEVRCGPLGAVSSCELILSPARRNPVEISLRPITVPEFLLALHPKFAELDQKLGSLLQESFGATITSCDPCITWSFTPLGTALTGDLSQRRIWLRGLYDVESHQLHPIDFGVLLVEEASAPFQPRLDKLWYAGAFFDSVEQLVEAYHNNSITKIKREPPTKSRLLFSTMNRRGEPYPQRPARAPRLVEPDGRRFSLQHQQVNYMGWTFHFRTSPQTGPAVYDVRFKGDRIAFEVALNDIAVYYSGHAPLLRTLDTIDSLYFMGTFAKALIPGGDCPETAVFAGMTVAGQMQRGSTRFSNSFCIFEQNDGIPLRRHLSYGQQYAGMLDSYLVLRAALAIGNYDYILDFMFHQNGVMDVRITSTGYIVVSPFVQKDDPYGFQIHQGITGNLHHHMFHFKVDLDISGTSNRYETLDISSEEVNLPSISNKKYHQLKFTKSLKTTEQEAIYDYKFETPKYHIVHNNANRTNLGEIKGYRLALNGMAKQLLPEGASNEPSISWARHQLVVTRHKDDEAASSSPYAGLDSLSPVTNFSSFYADDENIVDEDLVFWASVGMHHIPHTEDLPVTASTATKLGLSLSPYNYFPECPSMGSRDAIRIEYKDAAKPEEGVNLITYSDREGTCSMTESNLKSQLEEDPDIALRSNKPEFF